MELFIDDADISEIKRINDLYPVDGVTTNPTILFKAGRDPRITLQEVRNAVGNDRIIFAQAVASGAEGMVKDAHMIVELLGANTVVKIPAAGEGFKAIRILAKEGIRTCGTVVYTPMQGYLAAKAGASYVAPYVNRIDNMGYDGIGTVMKIQDILNGCSSDCKVLAASFKNSQQVLELAAYGIGAATAAPSVIDGFVNSKAILGAVDDFQNDFEKLTGIRAMTDLK